MQPTLPQSAGAADMDLPAVQSMDWLFKKERIYLLAQFWQQVSILHFSFRICLNQISNFEQCKLYKCEQLNEIRQISMCKLVCN